MNLTRRDNSFKIIKIEDTLGGFANNCSLKNTLKKLIGKGSINESVINLCILSIGIGILALPQKVQYITLVFTPILIVFFALINFWTFTILGDTARKYRVNKYEDIIETMFNPYFYYFFLIIICLGLLGKIILFQVILYKFIGGIINEIFSYDYINMDSFLIESFWGKKQTKFIVCYLFVILVFFPLGMIKTFSQMRYLNAFGVFSIFIIIFIIVIQFPIFYYHNVVIRKMKINVIDFSKGFGPDLKFITSISTIVYAYECHAGIFPVLSNLNEPTKKRVNSVFRKSTYINSIFYIIITLFGYLSQPEKTPDLILERQKISNSDYLMTFGLILYCITIITKISSLFNCLKSLLLNIMKYNIDNYPTNINILLIFIIFSISTFVAVVFQNISDYISLISSFYGLLIANIIPGIIYIRTNENSQKIKCFVLIILIVFCSIGALTIYFTLKKLVKI